MKKVIVAAPVKSGALNIVMGVNDHLYEPDQHHLLTAASCTTNCLAPVVKVIHEAHRHHARRHHDDPRHHEHAGRGRRAAQGPASRTREQPVAHPDDHRLGDRDRADLPGAARQAQRHRGSRSAAERLAHRLRLRGAAADHVEEVNEAFKRAAEGPLEGILGYEERPLVSVDFKDDPRSAIVDAPSTMVVDGTCVKVLAWYDNEIGYVHRMIELAAKVGAAL